MTRSLPFALLSAAALASGGMAYAQTPAAKPVAAAHVKATTTAKTTTVAKTTIPAAKTAPKTVAKATATKRVTASAAGGHMVTTKTSTGKTITYNCSKAGNANKKACGKS